MLCYVMLHLLVMLCYVTFMLIVMLCHVLICCEQNVNWRQNKQNIKIDIT